MGREFIELFDKWAEDYDQTVAGQDEQYREVFEQYEQILETVASRSFGTVVEFGVGTGNLTEKLIAKGLQVYGVEPSSGMREQIAKRELAFTLLDGDFIQFPAIDAGIDSIVSTYAFHHLNDTEKETAIGIYSKLLGSGGKIIFADTAYLNAEEKEQIHASARELGYNDLLIDLQTEYYTTIDALRSMLERNGFQASFSRLNRYVWLIDATKTS
ncbi:class I SAM-dependent methyltransferase [Paenibacillus sp. NEAU-GSW1]|uniref:class I SAM-dependent DNA methyltransferase n=1 Tax=Paenibacillus sp. NEAU-GSW1 TaxID=2682486 RepID=UPI0012E1D6CC|nr:class I SAM-dependent methyltransferase [Paenibacillus sp. NEAU-GSW1]MUT67141.1 methyltransferase domain-containing protein [Paenibacillus sp. NEAU-GSW1]